jgi:hypothetical protein
MWSTCFFYYTHFGTLKPLGVGFGKILHIKISPLAQLSSLNLFVIYDTLFAFVSLDLSVFKNNIIACKCGAIIYINSRRVYENSK